MKKGDDLGWFQYGGSTVIVLYPSSASIIWDADLITASENALETVVEVGERIGHVGVTSRIG